MRTREVSGFIPHSIEELYKRLCDERPPGELALEQGELVWRLPHGVTVRVWLLEKYPEGYIGTSWQNSRGLVRELAHWHPAEDEIFGDLLDICQGRTFWVRKKRSLFEAPPLLMERERWERYSERKKQSYEVLE